MKLKNDEPIPGMTAGKASMLVKTMILAELIRQGAARDSHATQAAICQQLTENK